MTRHSRWFGKSLAFLMALAAWTIMAAGASAQNNKLMVMGDAAKRAVSNGDISGDTAAKVVQACQDFAAQHNFVAAIVVLDQTGNIVHSHRMDGIRPDEIESAMNKARAALFNRNATNTNPNAPNINVVTQVRGSLSRDFDTTPGGVPIIADNQMIGAVGVTGADTLSMNGDCARAGIAAVPGLMPPAPGGGGQQAAPPAR
jgi:glc operon protein GlcG